ncbi:AAA family ATPase [Campylobacter sp. RM9344]|uniref:DNA repair protein RecN n=1 Tax=Campylobacter californiensis TaxID=1032243 RepID=A0AAW3ZXR3_9BACT|nr:MULTISPECIES: AAA family ATPase [unclassified Campylobacter]MBE2984738.1 AAA family ATPase [Campylobacter sp. RM6883]MBE2986928.1 AAA family ATPase [Campylobacter sp. RM12919]MBE2987784.1 AAA family ATPase [Campylobacter sp. RM12920]MBE2994654.1 AAA family ATPase [Campylobacter sp. RM6913]MBE3021518.1 AAA family ATPase [Campylobacter sp. 7477a]MBE3029180.1 AAA family ATPase [Campylobacter sp. RM9344]
MIERILIKDYLNFSNVELNFKDGLSVFTGVSGAGKSVLMSAIMAIFGLKDSEARVIEADIDHKFDMDEFGIENEPINNFKLIKDKATRYFINSQSVSKKNLAKIAKEHIKYLSAKEINEFENERFLNLLDFLECKKEPKFKALKEEFKDKFEEFIKIKKELNSILEDEKKVEELKEFAAFEINKIESVSPKIGEFDELMDIKKRLSKKDKINEAWNKAEAIFSTEKAVIDALHISDIDVSFFEETMNELRIVRDNLNMDELEDIDIEAVLDRIEALNSIVKRYGSIEEALQTLEKRKIELNKYENISFEKGQLEQKFKQTSSEINKLAKNLNKARKRNLTELENLINSYLKELYMSEISLFIEPKALDELGMDEIILKLNETALKNLSSGELNRLRLAFIASETQITQEGNGVIILDEIDANLSGKEAMSIANVLLKLAKFYQIFAISHQPQLSSKANSHFLVEKNGEISTVKELEKGERANELARMISGEHISKEAMEFARGLLK